MFQKKPFINLALILALLFAFAQTMGGALGFEPRALILVLSGTLITVLIRYGVSGLADGLAATTTLKEDYEGAVNLALRADMLAEKTHQNGITAIEDYDDENAYFQEGLSLALAGEEPEEVNKILAEKMQHELEAAKRGCLVFRTVGESSPIFGFLGTLAGYVLILQNFGDVEAYGPPLAFMIMSTVYGILLAYLVALPIADLLEVKCREKAQSFSAILDGISAIQRGSRAKEQASSNQEA
jgi:chemotaxis protein MotA